MNTNKVVTLSDSTTDTGRLKNSVLLNLRSQAVKRLEEYGFTKAENGKMYMPIALTDKGGSITINLDVSIGVDTDFKKKPTKSGRGRTAKAVEVPNLFE